jgi:hypothetical protein
MERWISIGSGNIGVGNVLLVVVRQNVEVGSPGKNYEHDRPRMQKLQHRLVLRAVHATV